MIKIPQYETIFSLYISLLAILPCIVLNFMGKKSKLLTLFTSAVMIMAILGMHTIQVFEFILFMIYQTCLVFGFKLFRKRCTSEFVYFIVLISSIIPLLFVKGALLNDKIASYVGFMGISYICFKIWQIIIDIHDNKIEKMSLLDFLTFTTFFPSFSSGPIARYQAFTEEMEKKCDDYFVEQFQPGLNRILKGVFYKFAVAFLINNLIISKLPAEGYIWAILIYVYAYTIYLYLDFSGFTEIAIGIGLLMGVKLPENFNHPFLACNFKEFWHRWHISLSSWFQDYVYSRFVLDNIRNGLFKDRRFAGRCGLFFTMLVMGIWHGFVPRYILYGVYLGIFLVLSDVWTCSKIYRSFRNNRFYAPVCRFVTFNILAFGILIFTGKYLFE